MKKVKPIRVFVLVNVLQSVGSEVYANHCHFFTWSAKNIPGIEFRFWAPLRTSIDNARNTAAHYAMELDCDYLMFLDDDVQIPENALKLLLDADKDIVAGLVMIRGYPFHVMAFKFEGEDKDPETGVVRKGLGYYDDIKMQRLVKKTWIPEDKITKKTGLTKRQWSKLPMSPIPLQAVDAVGFSCCLIKIDLLKACPEPFFLTGKHHTEDVYFCMKVVEHLQPKPSIFLHTGVPCGHMMNPQPIEFGSKHVFKVLHELMYNAKEKPFSRDEQYIESCLRATEEGAK